MDARRFFMVAIPQLVSRKLSQFGNMHGTIAVKVKGLGGWTIQLGDLEEPVLEGADNGADLTMWFSSWAFDGFVDGKLDLREAIDRRELGFRGDVGLLEQLGNLLQPGASPLATRLGMVG